MCDVDTEFESGSSGKVHMFPYAQTPFEIGLKRGRLATLSVFRGLCSHVSKLDWTSLSFAAFFSFSNTEFVRSGFYILVTEV